MTPENKTPDVISEGNYESSAKKGKKTKSTTPLSGAHTPVSGTCNTVLTNESSLVMSKRNSCNNIRMVGDQQESVIDLERQRSANELRNRQNKTPMKGY